MRYLRLVLEMLSESKKARALLVSLFALALTPLAVKFGADQAVLEGYLDKGLLMLAAYILGQGIADIGKETKKLDE
jgi:hypothetical protein